MSSGLLSSLCGAAAGHGPFGSLSLPVCLMNSSVAAMPSFVLRSFESQSELGILGLVFCMCVLFVSSISGTPTGNAGWSLCVCCSGGFLELVEEMG